MLPNGRKLSAVEIGRCWAVNGSGVRERTLLHALLLLEAGGALAIQLAGVGSAAMLTLLAIGLFLALVLEALFSGAGAAQSAGAKGKNGKQNGKAVVQKQNGKAVVQKEKTAERAVPLWVYALAQVVPLLTGAQTAADC